MTAFLGGGEARTWNFITFEKGGAVTATASFRQTPHKAELILHGHAGEAFASKGGLSLELRYRGIYEEGDAPIGFDMLYLPEGMRGPIWTSTDAPERPQIDFIVFDIWGDVGRLEAVFQGQLCLRRYIYSPTDIEDCLTLSGKIATNLAVE